MSFGWMEDFKQGLAADHILQPRLGWRVGQESGTAWRRLGGKGQRDGDRLNRSETAPLQIPTAICECECDGWCNLSRASIQSTVDAIHLDSEAVVLSFFAKSQPHGSATPCRFPESGSRVATRFAWRHPPPPCSGRPNFRLLGKLEHMSCCLDFTTRRQCFKAFGDGLLLPARKDHTCTWPLLITGQFRTPSIKSWQ